MISLVVVILAIHPAELAFIQVQNNLFKSSYLLIFSEFRQFNILCDLQWIILPLHQQVPDCVP